MWRVSLLPPYYFPISHYYSPTIYHLSLCSCLHTTYKYPTSCLYSCFNLMPVPTLFSASLSHSLFSFHLSLLSPLFVKSRELTTTWHCAFVLALGGRDQRRGLGDGGWRQGWHARKLLRALMCWRCMLSGCARARMAWRASSCLISCEHMACIARQALPLALQRSAALLYNVT